MKYILIVLFALTCSAALGQKKGQEPDVANPIAPFPVVDNKYHFEEVVQVPGATQDQLFIRARSWAFKGFRSFKDVDNTSDKETGTLLLNANTGNLPSKSFGFYAIGCGRVRFRMSIYCKEGKYKYIITDFVHEADHGNHRSIGPLESKKKRGMPAKEIEEKTYKMMTDMIEELKKEMAAPSESDF